MAIWSSDFSLASIPSRKSLPRTSLSISTSHGSSITFSSKRHRILNVNFSNSPSHLLEEAANGVPVIQVPSNSPARQPSPISDLDLTNEFICGLCRVPQTEALAFEYYQKAREQPKFHPDRRTFNLLIRILLKHKQWGSISALVEDFGVFNLFPDRSMCTRLVSGCVKARRFKLAESLLRILATRKGTTAISTFCSAMHGYNKLHMHNCTVAVYDQVRMAGLPLNSGCYRWIMDAYRKMGDTETVLALFLEFESKSWNSLAISVEIYSILLDSLGRAGRAFEAFKYFKEMEKKEIQPNPSIYSSLICSFAGTREVEMAEDLLQKAREKGMVRDSSVFMKLVMMYVEVELVEKTIRIVEAMMEMGLKVPDCILCAVVNGFAKKRGLKASVWAYDQCIFNGCEPGQVTYASIINVYGRLGLFQKAEMVFLEMMEKGFDKCVVAYSNMISMYGKVGRVRDAMRLLAKMKEKGCEPNVYVYNSLIDMHGRRLNLRQVEKVWKEMKRRRVEPDKISYTSIISAYNKARKLDECIRFYEEFKMNRGKVDRVLAGIMVGVFSKGSRFDELVKLLQDMKSEGTGLDERLYESALNALRDAGLQVHMKWFEKSFGLKKIDLMEE
ncbi:pentatricopeptide repeat-containing protein At5g13770, chloroplastic [Phoenix dactylifera]|uniref:Pentatricopeptide repeat-containing protein At5g13770, chloroplastic n=1 Tax=Phoenix dactylifera TaxID=42345 RepID=A0A8B7BJT5_PHODC|nr:pentatricopeptide repeat-containing protein At5g13770, chloroplastic [Phoenix dactylifera]